MSKNRHPRRIWVRNRKGDKAHLSPPKITAGVIEGVFRKRGANVEVADEIVCGQRHPYLQLAIEEHAVVLAGGLTRTETQPAILRPFHGARVGSA